MSAVSFVRCKKNTLESIKHAISESLSLIGYIFPSEIKRVLIKPNMCYYWDYSTGQTTDPKFVAALIELLREKTSSNVKISVAESDASAMKCKYAFTLLGYEKLADEYNVNLVNLTEDESEPVKVSVNGLDFDFSIPQTISAADLCIGVPKIKYMAQVRVSAAMKNLFGCNPMELKYKLHPRLDEAIVALNKIMKFDLHILDGLVLFGAFSRRLNLVMASEDPVAFDAAASRIAGENPRRIRYIGLAEKEGLGTASYVAKGLKPAMIGKEYPRRTSKNKFIAFAYNAGVKVGIFEGE